MRVMQLTTDLRFAGTERVILNLSRGLRERGVECAVVGLLKGGEAPGGLRRRLEREGFTVRSAGLEGKFTAWRLSRLLRFAAEWKPDLLHCHMFHGNAAGALLRILGVRCPQVWTHHVVERRRLPLRGAFYRLLGRMPECHVFVSEAVRRYRRSVAETGRREVVIYNGTELAPFLAVRPRPGPVFGAVGRLDRQKGFDVLVRAFARLCRERDDVMLRIAGVGPERPALEELAAAEGAAGRVELVGFVEDVPAFLAGVNVFVNPSRWEGFGLTLLEALAAGLPCIASRVDSLPEVGGDLVHWVPPDDVEALHEALRAHVGVRQSAERAARQRAAAARFSKDAMTEQYLQLYRSLV